MEIVEHLLVLVHLLGMAAIVGSAVRSSPAGR